MIIGEIRRFLRDNNMIRVSRSVRDLAYKALSAREKLASTHLQEPTVAEIAEKLRSEGTETTEREVSEALEAITAPISLFDPAFGDGDGDPVAVMDQIGDPDCNDENWLDNIALADALKKLGQRERSIISKRFFAGKTQTEIAEEIGISQAQVSRLEKGAMDQIRKAISPSF